MPPLPTGIAVAVTRHERVRRDVVGARMDEGAGVPELVEIAIVGYSPGRLVDRQWRVAGGSAARAQVIRSAVRIEGEVPDQNAPGPVTDRGDDQLRSIPACDTCHALGLVVVFAGIGVVHARHGLRTPRVTVPRGPRDVAACRRVVQDYKWIIRGGRGRLPMRVVGQDARVQVGAGERRSEVLSDE